MLQTSPVLGEFSFGPFFQTEVLPTTHISSNQKGPEKEEQPLCPSQRDHQ